MGNLWLKIKFWAKITIVFLAAMLIVVLLSRNWNNEVSPKLDLLFWKFDKPNFLMVTLCTSVASIVGWWLLRTSVKTIRQFRGLRDRTRTERMERELAEMKAKAAKLQTRDERPAAQEPAPDEDA